MGVKAVHIQGPFLHNVIQKCSLKKENKNQENTITNVPNRLYGLNYRHCHQSISQKVFSAKYSRSCAWWTQSSVVRNHGRQYEIHGVTKESNILTNTVDDIKFCCHVGWKQENLDLTASSCKQAIWLAQIFKALIVFTNWPARLQFLFSLSVFIIVDTNGEKKWGDCKKQGACQDHAESIRKH